MSQARNPFINNSPNTLAEHNIAPDLENDSTSQILDGDYDIKLEVIGDIHEKDLEDYKETLNNKYSDEKPDAVLATGDLITNTDIRANIPTQPPETAKEDFEYTVDVLDQIGEELGTEVYVVPGNHDPIKGAHPDNEHYIGQIEELYSEEIEDSVFDHVIGQKENVTNLEYGMVQLEDMSIIGGSHFYEPEPDPDKIPTPEIDDLYEEQELEVISEILENQQSNEYGTLGSFISGLPLVGSVWDYTANFLGYGTEPVEAEDITLEDIEELQEEYSQRQIMSEEHEEYLESYEEVTKEYQEKYELMKTLLDNAGEDVVLLDHFTFDTDGESELDKLGEANKGSPAMRDAIKEFKDDKNITMFFGHRHEPGHEEIMGVDAYGAGEDYIEVGMNKGAVEDYKVQESKLSNPKPNFDAQQNVSQPNPVQSQPSRQEMMMKEIENMEEAGGPEQFYQETEDILEDILQRSELSEEELARKKQKRKEQLEKLWENRDNIRNE